jgi:hypothetical protein
MPIRIVNQAVVIGSHHIVAEDFTGLVQRHLGQVADTREIESDTERMQRAQRPDEEWKDFVKQVIVWGGGRHRILGRVMDSNSPSTIRNTLQEAARKLSEVPPNIGDSLDVVQWINGLGVSYGSKVLRFLRPDICPVLDSRISEEAGYSNDSSGYCQYAFNASKIARFLETNSIGNPMQRSQGAWFAGDVDMALYAKIQGWAAR